MLIANTVLFAVMAIAQAKSPVGMILMTDSAVQVQRGTARTPARLGDLLSAGDRVTTGSGQVTFLFCPSEESALCRCAGRHGFARDVPS